MTRRGSICLVLFTMFGLGSCGSSGSGSSPAAAAASSSPTTAAATVESGTPTTPVDPAALVDLLMKTFKVTNRPCVEKAVSEFPEDVLKIVESIAKNGNPTDNWPDNRALALVHIVQACPNGP
jgi:hypothetical protein